MHDNALSSNMNTCRPGAGQGHAVQKTTVPSLHIDTMPLLRRKHMSEEIDSTQEVIKEIAAPLYHHRIWLRILAISSITWGAISALTVVGIIIAWLPIWFGVLLYQSVHGLESAFLSGDKNVLLQTVRKLRTVVILAGIGTATAIAVELATALIDAFSPQLTGIG